MKNNVFIVLIIILVLGFSFFIVRGCFVALADQKIKEQHANELYERVRVEIFNGEFVSAEALLSQALKYNPDSIESQHLLKKIEEGKYNMAITIVKNTKTINSDNLTIAELYDNAGKSAKKVMEEVLGYKPWQYQYVDLGWDCNKVSGNDYLVWHGSSCSYDGKTTSTKSMFKVNIITKKIEPISEDAELLFKPYKEW